VGKIHISQALGRQGCRMGYKALYLKTAHLLANLGGGHTGGTWESRLRRSLKPAILILDRLVNRSHHVILTRRSYRPRLRPNRGQLIADKVEQLKATWVNNAKSDKTGVR